MSEPQTTQPKAQQQELETYIKKYLEQKLPALGLLTNIQDRESEERGGLYIRREIFRFRELGKCILDVEVRVLPNRVRMGYTTFTIIHTPVAPENGTAYVDLPPTSGPDDLVMSSQKQGISDALDAVFTRIVKALDAGSQVRAW